MRDENSVILANFERGSGEFWKILLLMENSGCLCEIWMLVRILLLATSCLDLFWSNLVSPVDAPPSFPGTLSDIRVHEKTHLDTPRRERVKWDEMRHVMSCYYVSMSCHVLSAWVVLAWPPCHVWQWEFAGTFSQRHRWVFVGTCHLCVHGLPAYTLWFRVSHTHTHPPTNTNPHPHPHPHAHTHTHTCTRTRARAPARVRARAHTHTRTHAHTHTPHPPTPLPPPHPPAPAPARACAHLLEYWKQRRRTHEDDWHE